MEAAQRQPDAVTEAQTRHGCGAAAVEIPKAMAKNYTSSQKKNSSPANPINLHPTFCYLQETPCHC